MNEDLKFPVKYAVLELKSEGGYSTNYEPVIEGYIVSKCFIIESAIKYFSGGTSKVVHKVYFPYDDIESFKSGEKQTRRTHFFNSYYPTHIVSMVFDIYEEAKKVAEDQNQNLLAKSAVYMPLNNPKFEKTYIKEKKTIIARLNICQRYEDFITENTKDMEVTKDNLAPIERIRKRQY